MRARIEAIDGRTPFKYQNEVSPDCAIYRRVRQMRSIVALRGLAMEMSECQVSRVIIFIVFPTNAIFRQKHAYFTNMVSYESHLLKKCIFFGFISKTYLYQMYILFFRQW